MKHDDTYTSLKALSDAVVNLKTLLDYQQGRLKYALSIIASMQKLLKLEVDNYADHEA